MADFPKFSVAFNIPKNNEDRIKAFELYQKAFDAKKISESPPEEADMYGGIYITMEINGFRILLAPGGERNNESVVTCELLYDNENDLRKAYDILIQEGHDYSIGSYSWAPVGALVTDKYGVTWWLRT
jgi:uncharacterized glyoxalase superfamily protein PhnB